jgi:hypothetical protein
MGNLRAVVTVASISFAAACGDDGGSSTIDAPNYDFSCYQNAAPTTATATVQISGTAQEVMLSAGGGSLIPSGNVTIQACKGNCNGPNDLGTSPATMGTGVSAGMYVSMAATTGGVPLEGYLIATKPLFRTNRVYPASPLTKNEAGVPVLMLSESQLTQLNSFGVINNDPGNAMLAVLATDCAVPPLPIDGAVVTVTQNGSMAGEAPFAAGTLAPQAAGLFLIGNVPPGDTTVSASYNGMTFRAHVVGAVADQITTTQVKPGF